MTKKRGSSEPEVPTEHVLCPFCDGPVRLRRISFEDTIVTPDGEDTGIVVDADELSGGDISYGLHCSGCDDWVDLPDGGYGFDPCQIPKLIEGGRLKLAAPLPAKKKQQKKAG